MRKIVLSFAFAAVLAANALGTAPVTAQVPSGHITSWGGVPMPTAPPSSVMASQGGWGAPAYTPDAGYQPGLSGWFQLVNAIPPVGGFIYHMMRAPGSPGTSASCLEWVYVRSTPTAVTEIKGLFLWDACHAVAGWPNGHWVYGIDHAAISVANDTDGKARYTIKIDRTATNTWAARILNKSTNTWENVESSSGVRIDGLQSGFIGMKASYAACNNTSERWTSRRTARSNNALLGNAWVSSAYRTDVKTGCFAGPTWNTAGTDGPFYMLTAMTP